MQVKGVSLKELSGVRFQTDKNLGNGNTMRGQ